jgi:hypothetical protein
MSYVRKMELAGSGIKQIHRRAAIVGEHLP